MSDYDRPEGPVTPSDEVVARASHDQEQLEREELDRMLASITDDDPAPSKPRIGTTLRFTAVREDDPYEYVPRIFIDAARTEVNGLATEVVLKLLGQANATFDTFGRSRPYRDVRVRACALSIVLNERDDNAPRFRPMRVPLMPSRHRTYPIDELWLARDRQVIDLHWLFRNANVVPGEEYASLFQAETFDFGKASQIATANWKAETKAKEVGHDEFAELLCGTLCTKEGKERWRTIRDGEDRLRRLLADKVLDPRSKVQRGDIHRWICVYRALMIGRCSPSLARDALKWMGQSQLAPSTIKEKLDTLRRWGLDMRGRRGGRSTA